MIVKVESQKPETQVSVDKIQMHKDKFICIFADGF